MSKRRILSLWQRLWQLVATGNHIKMVVKLRMTWGVATPHGCAQPDRAVDCLHGNKYKLLRKLCWQQGVKQTQRNKSLKYFSLLCYKTKTLRLKRNEKYEMKNMFITKKLKNNNYHFCFWCVAA